MRRSFLFAIIPLIALSHAFSTPARSSNRNLYNLNGYSQDTSQQNVPISYTNNYVTAIEDHHQNGFFVASTDHNYAIVSPCLLQQKWIGVSVNGDDVFIINHGDNSTRYTKLTSLTVNERDFIAEVRSNFTANLAGLKFAFYTSGSSLTIGNNQLEKTREQSYNNQQQVPPLTIEASNNMIDASMGGGAFGGNGIGGLFQPMDMQARALQNIASRTRATNFRKVRSADLKQKQRQLLLRSQKKPAGRRQLSATSLAGESPITPGGGGGLATVEATSASTYKPTIGECSKSNYPIETNYYNLNSSPLKKSLTGDIYYFDFYCNALDVYSSSVSVRRHADLSAIYRDQRYFSYASSNMQLTINRFFLLDDWVIFVYNDGNVVAKQNWMLDTKELDVIIKARQKLRLINGWQNKAANLFDSSDEVVSTANLKHQITKPELTLARSMNETMGTPVSKTDNVGNKSNNIN